MKIAFDIGGVLSKDKRWRELAKSLHDTFKHHIYIITDMHDINKTIKTLLDNGMGWIDPHFVHCSNYAQYGEACKAILLKELEIDVFFDDFIGYLQWDSQLGEAPIRCLVMPNWNKPYYSPDWTCEGEDFGRRVAPTDLQNNNLD